MNESTSEREETTTPTIILLTPPPLPRAKLEAFCLQQYGSTERAQRSNDASRAYGAMVKQIACEYSLQVVDVFDLLQGDHGPDVYGQYLVDGLHLNSRGNQRVYQGLMDVLQTKFPHLAPMTDGEGRHGTMGIPFQEKLWNEYYSTSDKKEGQSNS